MHGGVNGYERYLETAVETASPARLIVMLYDGAIRFINEAAYAMRQRDYETQNTKLQRAQKILNELICSLDFERGGEVAQNLYRLYNYMYNQLVAANIEDSHERLEHVVGLLSELREAWDTIATQAEAQVALPEARVSLHG